MLQFTTPRADLAGKTEAEIIDLIVERYRRRTAWHKAEKSLILQAKSILRRLCAGDKDAANTLYERLEKLKSEDLQQAIAGFWHNAPDVQLLEAVEETYPILQSIIVQRTERGKVEKELESLAKMLPIFHWFEEEDQDGASAGSLAAVIGSAGNLHSYATVQRLWKRMGLAVMSDGRQRPMRDAERALAHGYNPERRSVMWKIGTSMLRAQSAKANKKTGAVIRAEAGRWRKVYDKRKAYEAAKNEAGDYAEQAAKRLREASFDKRSVAYMAYSQGKLPLMHLHNRAQRYVEKAFLRALWQEWRKVMAKPKSTDIQAQDVPLLAAE